MKTPIKLSSGREVILHLEGPIVKQPISGMTEWVQALRSGCYKQTKYMLHTEAGYCCLGVKRDLEGCKWYRKERYDWEVTQIFRDGDQLYNYKGTCGLEKEGKLPNEASVIFYSVENNVNIEIEKSKLSELNDKGFTFQEIADIIDIFYENATR